MIPGAKQTFGAALQNLLPELVKSLTSVFNMVLSDFDLMSVVEETPDHRRDALQGQLQRFVDSARDKINGPITVEFARAEAKAKEKE